MIRLLPYFLLTALVIAGYGNTLQHSFHYDDIPQILEKPWVRGLDKIPDFITNPFIRPVVILSFNLNHAVSGFEVWSYHVTNIALHLLVVLMVYRLILLTGRGVVREGIQPPVFRRMAFTAAGLFALHPLNVQTVTYISSRSSALCTLFYLITIELFIRGWFPSVGNAQGTGKKHFPLLILAAVSLALGAMSKIIIITIPAILFLFHFYFLSGQKFKSWMKTQAAPLLMVAVPLVGFIGARMASKEGVLPTGKTYLSPSDYLLTETFVIPFEYFRKMLLPINQSIEVDFPIFNDWFNPLHYGGILTLAFFVWGICRLSRNQPWMGFGLAWMGITLLPTSSFVPLHDVAVEHRTYLALVGGCIAAAGFLEWLWVTQHKTGPARNRRIEITAAVILILMAALLVNRNAVWKDEITLWADARKKAPDLVRPYNNLGEAYDKQLNYPRAIEEFEAALKIDPNYVYALNNLGNVYGKLENFQQSIGFFKRVLELDPNYAPAYYNLARAYQAVKQPGPALEAYRKAIELVPYFEQAIYNFAMLSVQAGNPAEAVEYFKKFIDLQPGNVRGYFGMGNAYMAQRQGASAIEWYEKAIKIDPRYLLAYVNLAAALMQAGHFDKAIDTYNKILKQSPIAGVHKNLGLIYLQQKKDDEKALYHFTESLRLEPNQPEARGIQQVIDQLTRERTP